MSISKFSKKLPLISLLKHPNSSSSLFLNPIHNNFNSTLQSRVYTVFTNQFTSKKPLISHQFGRNYSSSSSHVGEIASQELKSKKTLKWLTGLVVGMVGLTYASVPLYRTFCQLTGYGGTVQRSESIEEKIARHAQDGSAPKRDIVVQFNADVSDGMQWKFIPTQREVRVKPGESALAFFTAENRSSIPITGVSSYNVTPQKAGKYFNKIQCFCFEEQLLLPGEQIDMPVFFYIDPEIESDATMNGVNNIILSYTFFIAPEK